MALPRLAIFHCTASAIHSMTLNSNIMQCMACGNWYHYSIIGIPTSLKRGNKVKFLCGVDGCNGGNKVLRQPPRIGTKTHPKSRATKDTAQNNVDECGGKCLGDKVCSDSDVSMESTDIAYLPTLKPKK